MRSPVTFLWTMAEGLRVEAKGRRPLKTAAKEAWTGASAPSPEGWTQTDFTPMRVPFLPLAPTVRKRRVWQKRGITNYRQISAHVIQADTQTTTWISLPTSLSRYRRIWKTSPTTGKFRHTSYK